MLREAIFIQKHLTSDSMCKEHEEWCIVQRDGTLQSSMHMHPNVE